MSWYRLDGSVSVWLDSIDFANNDTVMAMINYGLLSFRVCDIDELELIKQEFMNIFNEHNEPPFPLRNLPIIFTTGDEQYILFVPLEGKKKYASYIHSQSLMKRSKLEIQWLVDIRIQLIVSPQSSVWISKPVKGATIVASDPPTTFDTVVVPDSLVTYVDKNTIGLFKDDKGVGKGISYLLYYHRTLLPPYLNEKHLVGAIYQTSVDEIKMMAFQANLLSNDETNSGTCHIVLYEKPFDLTSGQCKHCKGNSFLASVRMSKEFMVQILPKSNFNPSQCIGVDYTNNNNGIQDLIYSVTTSDNNVKRLEGIFWCCLYDFLMANIDKVFCLWPPYNLYKTHIRDVKRNGDFINCHFRNVMWLNDFKILNIIIKNP